MRISLFGLGYVGTVSGACLARLGHNVLGVDTDAAKVDLINAGRSPIVEPGLNGLIEDQVSRGRLRATSSAQEAVLDTDISFVSVGTPSESTGGVSLTALDNVISEVGSAIRQKKSAHAVVIRSTVPPGTTEQHVAPLLSAAAGRSLGDGLELCSNPEFLREGSSIQDFSHPAFTLVGALSSSGHALLAEVYRDIDAPIVATTPRVAEAVKYLSNAFHALKITFANEAGILLKELQVDSREALRLFCQDTVLNISPAYLRPGFAFGGSCLPKDIRGLMSLAHSSHADIPMIGSILPSNERQIQRAYDMIARHGRRRVALFGLAFKPGTDDLRESPMVTLAEQLLGKGFGLAICDRSVETTRLVGRNRAFIDKEIPHLETLLTADARNTLSGAETIVVASAHPEDINTIARHHNSRPIIDLCGVSQLEHLDGANYEGLCW